MYTICMPRDSFCVSIDHLGVRHMQHPTCHRIMTHVFKPKTNFKIPKTIPGQSKQYDFEIVKYCRKRHLSETRFSKGLAIRAFGTVFENSSA